MLDITSSSSNNLDSSWAIFDHRSIDLANQQFGITTRPPGPMTQVGLQGTFDANVNANNVGNHAGGGGGGGYEMDFQGQWMSNEQYSEAWQSTLFRLFGSSDLPLPDNGML